MRGTRPSYFEAVEATIVSINTWKCDGDYYKRREVLARQLLDLNPDVVCCQEVFATKDGKVSTASYLADALGLSRDYFPSRQKVREVKDLLVDSFSGLCVLSRLHPSRSDQWFLPTDLRDGDRTAQLTQIEAGESSLAIVNTHLTHLADADALRQRQIREITERLKTLDCTRSLILGDFNMTPGSSAYAYACHQLGLADVFAENPTATHVGGSRIDYVFGYGNVEVREKAIVLNEQQGGILPSDHFGLMLRVTI